MRRRKILSELTALEWEVLHAVQDCVRAGRFPAGESFYARLSHVNRETARRLKNELIRDGLVDLGPRTVTPRAPEPYRAQILSFADLAEIAAAVRAVEESRENRQSAEYPGKSSHQPDIIDLMSRIPEMGPPAAASRTILRLWVGHLGARESG